MKLALRMVVVALVAIVVFAIAGVAATWAPDRSVDSLKARWAQPPSQFIDVAGLQVHLRDEGPRDDPIPIVLLPWHFGQPAHLGWLGSNLEQNATRDSF
jgi:hypothetical protein